jgi:hypothetical protein
LVTFAGYPSVTSMLPSRWEVPPLTPLTAPAWQLLQVAIPVWEVWLPVAGAPLAEFPWQVPQPDAVPHGGVVALPEL